MSVHGNDYIILQRGEDIFKERVNSIPGAARSTMQLNSSGRVYCYNDARWVTNADDNYGVNYYQWAESGGTGINPIQEWEHKGDYIRQGTALHELSMFGRILDANTVADMEILVSFTDPNGRWDGVGLDGDGEDTHITLYRGFWKAGGSGTPAFTHPVNDNTRQKFSLGNFIAPVDGDLRIYFKPVNVTPRPNTSTDYAQFSTSFLISVPNIFF